MKILVDENIPLIAETFAKHGKVITYAGRTLSAKHLEGIDALITRSVTKVNAELLAKAQPKFVGTCTIGTDHLDIPLLESHSIQWASAPGCNAQSVVDYVLSVLASFNRINFLAEEKLPTIGIVGCGNVGGLLRRRFIQMGLTVRIYDPFLDGSDIPELTSLDEVFSSNIVCMHTPFTSSGDYPTANMVSNKQLELLPKDACLISAGRGGVLVESDLSQFMEIRPDVQVALDVWESEPSINTDLLGKVHIATPHIAGYSLEGKCRGTLQIYQAFCEAFGFEPSVGMGFISTFDHKILEGVFNKDNGSAEQLILSAYDPKTDTERMRDSWKSATLQEQREGSWFDALRRHYPERRELASCKLRSATSEASIALLKKVGFVNFL